MSESRELVERLRQRGPSEFSTGDKDAVAAADLIERQAKIIEEMSAALMPFHDLWAAQPPASGTYWKCPQEWCKAAHDAVSARALTKQ